MEKCEVVRYADNGERLNPCDKLQEIIDTNTIKLFEVNGSYDEIEQHHMHANQILWC